MFKILLENLQLFEHSIDLFCVVLGDGSEKRKWAE